MKNSSEGLWFPVGKAFLLQKAAGLGGANQRVLLWARQERSWKGQEPASKSPRTIRILSAKYVHTGI